MSVPRKVVELILLEEMLRHIKGQGSETASMASPRANLVTLHDGVTASVTPSKEGQLMSSAWICARPPMWSNTTSLSLDWRNRD